MSLLKDFKDFAMKGNVIDLAIGVIIGAAFGKIVSSLVDDIIMPPIGMIIGGIDFQHLSLQLAPGKTLADGTVSPPVLIRYGNFIQVLIQFLIVAFVIFMIVQAMMKLERKKEAKVQEAPAPSELNTQEKLLTEIRDLLGSDGASRSAKAKA